MNRLRVSTLCLFLAACSVSPIQAPTAIRSQAHLRSSLNSAQSDYLRFQDREARREAREERRRREICREDPSAFECSELERIEVTGSRIDKSDLITNNQEAGVDEGGIVKKLGTKLLVLREGHLHVIETAGAASRGLQPLHSHKIVGDDSEDDIWYDEILAFRGGVLLLGFNFRRGTAELFVFELEARGRLDPRGRWMLQVNDYFSGNDYGARIRGNELVLSLQFGADALLEDMWPHAARIDATGEPIEASKVDLLAPDDLQVLDSLADWPQAYVFLRCDLDGLLQRRLDCQRSAAVANHGASSYVSSSGIYLTDFHWQPSAWHQPGFDPWSAKYSQLEPRLYRSRVLRLPLDPSEPSIALPVSGLAGDRYSFMESRDGLYLLTEEHAPEQARLNILQHLPFDAFRPGSSAVAEERRRFPGRIALARFAPEALWVVIESDDAGDSEDGGRLVLRQPLDGASPTTQQLPFEAERVELLQNHVLFLGNVYGDDDEPQHLQSVLLSRSDGRMGPGRLYPNQAARLDDRSHSFNSARLANGTDVAGLTVSARLPKGFENADVNELPEDLLILGRREDALEILGRVDMQHVADCELDCWEWYGSTRFFAFGERLFALSGEVLKELRIESSRLHEVSSVRLRP